jgi:hypothetical protein
MCHPHSVDELHTPEPDLGAAAQRHERAPTILNMSNRSIPRSASGPIPQLSGYVGKKINQPLINL